MEKFKILESDVNLKPFLYFLDLHKNDWVGDKIIPGVQGINRVIGCIPLTLATKNINSEIDIDDVEEQKNTPFYKKYKVFPDFAKSRGFKKHGRMGIFKLNPDQMNATHSENGVYYDKRHRYHLSITGTYELIVDGVSHIITPGMFFWFDNKLPHSAKNIGNDVRISFVFDALQSIEYKKPKS